MDIVTKGSKPVVYKSNIRLKFYSADIEDSRAAVKHIFTKIMSDGSVVAFGEYTVLLLFSYLNSQNRREYITETQATKFSEKIGCKLPEDAKGGSLEVKCFDARASFEPRVICARGAGGLWSIEVEGEIDVLVYGDKAALNLYLASSGLAPQSSSDSATVVRIGGDGVPADELLNMDADEVKKISQQNAEPHGANKPEQ